MRRLLSGPTAIPLARTPAIDGLAAQGIRFDTAYVDAPVCAPSRFALITGLYSATAGPAHHMRALAQLPASVRGWPELLRQAGYSTVNNAKTDYNADIDGEATWDASGPQAHWRNRPAGGAVLRAVHHAHHEHRMRPQTPPPVSLWGASWPHPHVDSMGSSGSA